MEVAEKRFQDVQHHVSNFEIGVVTRARTAVRTRILTDPVIAQTVRLFAAPAESLPYRYGTCAADSKCATPHRILHTAPLTHRPLHCSSCFGTAKLSAVWLIRNIQICFCDVRSAQHIHLVEHRRHRTLEMVVRVYQCDAHLI